MACQAVRTPPIDDIGQRTLNGRRCSLPGCSPIGRRSRRCYFSNVSHLLPQRLTDVPQHMRSGILHHKSTMHSKVEVESEAERVRGVGITPGERERLTRIPILRMTSSMVFPYRLNANFVTRYSNCQPKKSKPQHRPCRPSLLPTTTTTTFYLARHVSKKRQYFGGETRKTSTDRCTDRRELF